MFQQKEQSCKKPSYRVAGGQGQSSPSSEVTKVTTKVTIKVRGD